MTALLTAVELSSSVHIYIYIDPGHIYRALHHISHCNFHSPTNYTVERYMVSFSLSFFPSVIWSTEGRKEGALNTYWTKDSGCHSILQTSGSSNSFLKATSKITLLKSRSLITCMHLFCSPWTTTNYCHINYMLPSCWGERVKLLLLLS